MNMTEENDSITEDNTVCKDTITEEKIEEVTIKPPQDHLEIEEELDKNIQSGKPKKVRTQKQIEAFEKARKTRAENVKKRAEQKKINTQPVGRPKKKIEEKIEEHKEVEICNIEENLSSSEEEEIIYKKKPTKSKPKSKKKKKPIKKKIVYISSSSSSSDNETDDESEEEVVKTILKRKKKKVQYYDDDDDDEYYSNKTMSLTDFYKIV